MNPNVIAALAESEIAASESIEECPNDGVQAMDGTGAHLGLRDPWWNSLSHTISDSSIFRIILIIMVMDYVLKWLK